jgi:hypothetical protein
MKLVYLLLIGLCLLAAGCSTYTWNARGYDVLGAATNSADVEKIRGIARKAADKSGLTEQPQYTGQYDCIVLYKAGAVTLEAGYRRDAVSIGLIGGHRSSTAYRTARKILASDLQAEFGKRVVLSP